MGWWWWWCRGRAGRGQRVALGVMATSLLAHCPAPRGGEQRGLIWCQAGMLSAFQSQLHGRAGCLRFHFRCQIFLFLILFLFFFFFTGTNCGCMTKQLSTAPSTLKDFQGGGGKKGRHTSGCKKKIKIKNKKVHRNLWCIVSDWTGSAFKELRSALR